MKRIVISMMAGLLMIVGCTKEAEPQFQNNDYLVIKAECGTLTKTDMVKGESSWEAGDVITVVYDGKAYEYVASAAGETTVFTSTAGITGYDASKPITAYYPATDADGTVKIEAEKTVTFKAGSQANSSCAPLVGTPKDNNLVGGALSMVFRNIFSVIELDVDAGNLAGKAKSLTLEPADASEFEGYLTVAGTVDPKTLAVTATSTGNTLKVVLPENADPAKAMTVKIPVGRFLTAKGLKVTFETTEGKFDRTIYKTGLATFEEKNGVFHVKHFIKPMYAFEASKGGIATAADLMEFAAAVNAGESFAKWMNSEGKVVLLNDIDMASVTSWTPVGDAVSNWASNKLEITSGNPFTGYFDGKGFSIKNFNMVCTNSKAGAAWGLFGVLGAGAVVENIVIDSSCSLQLKSTAPTDCGVVAGLVWDGKVRNITNNASMTYDGDASANKRVTMAVVGMAFAQADSVVIKNVVNNGVMKASDGGTTQNGGNAVQVAGILGFGTNHVDSGDIVAVVGCVNNADMESATARTSGIVAACNRYTHIRGCINYGNQINTHPKAENSRLGNITCITGAGSAIYDTKNYGDVVSTTKGAAGGILCLVNADDNVLDGVENYGNVITDRENNKYKGSFFGQCSKNATIRNCVAGGAVGMYNGGNYQMETVTADNYFDFIGQVGSAAKSVTKENIRYGTK